MRWFERDPEALHPEFVCIHGGVRYKLRLMGGLWDEGFALYANGRRVAGPFMLSSKCDAWGNTTGEVILPLSSRGAMSEAERWIRAREKWQRVRTPGKFRRRRLR